MSGGSGLESSSGKVGIWPVTKHQPSTSTAWLNGATGVGAPGAMKNSGALIGILTFSPDVPILHDIRARHMPRKVRRSGGFRFRPVAQIVGIEGERERSFELADIDDE